MRPSQLAEPVRDGYRISGRTEKTIEARRESLRAALEFCFGAPIPDDLDQLIDDSKNAGELCHWFAAALSVPTLDEVRATMKA